MVSKQKYVQAKLYSMIMTVAVVVLSIVFFWATSKHMLFGQSPADLAHVLGLFVLMFVFIVMFCLAAESAYQVSVAGYAVLSSPSPLCLGSSNEDSFHSTDLPADIRPPRDIS